MTELVVHRVAPKSRTLVFSTSTTLESKPRPLRALHIPPPGPRFIVKRETGTALLAVCGEVEFRNHPSNDLVIQTFGVVEGELFQPLAKIRGPLTHNIVGGDHLRFEIVTCAPDNHIVNVGIPKRL